MCAWGSATQCMGKNKFPWVVATACLAVHADEPVQNQSRSSSSACALPLLTHKFNVCLPTIPRSKPPPSIT